MLHNLLFKKIFILIFINIIITLHNNFIFCHVRILCFSLLLILTIYLWIQHLKIH